jgi:hypothetical protein
MKIRVNLSTSLRHKYVEVGVLFSLVGLILFAIIQLSNTQNANGFTHGENQSISSETWKSTNTLQKK